jgi:hypothetical protein
MNLLCNPIMMTEAVQRSRFTVTAWAYHHWQRRRQQLQHRGLQQRLYHKAVSMYQVDTVSRGLHKRPRISPVDKAHRALWCQSRLWRSNHDDIHGRIGGLSPLLDPLLRAAFPHVHTCCNSMDHACRYCLTAHEKGMPQICWHTANRTSGNLVIAVARTISYRKQK